MPQVVTYSVGAKVDKGPDVKSESKVEVASYSAVLEEVICRCSMDAVEVNLRCKDLACVDAIVITADKYFNDKDACMPKTGNKLPLCNYVQYWVCPMSCPPDSSGAGGGCQGGSGKNPPAPNTAQNKGPQGSNTPYDCYEGTEEGPNTSIDQCHGPYDLTRPHAVTDPFIQTVFHGGIERIVFKNNLSTDIKVSVLVVRKLRPKCRPNLPTQCEPCAR